MNLASIKLPHQKQSLTEIIQQTKATQKLAATLLSNSSKNEALGDKVAFSSDKNIQNPKDFKKLAKEIEIGWTVTFQFGKRERKGKILAKNSRGLVCSVAFMGSNKEIKTERLTVKSNQIIEIFKNRL